MMITMRIIMIMISRKDLGGFSVLCFLVCANQMVVGIP